MKETAEVYLFIIAAKPVYLQPVDSQSDASCSVVVMVGQNFNGAPEEAKGPDAGGLVSPLLLLLSWDLQGCLQHQLCQTLPGSRQI